MNFQQIQQNLHLLELSFAEAHTPEAVLNLKLKLKDLIVSFNNLDKSSLSESPSEVLDVGKRIADLRSSYQDRKAIGLKEQLTLLSYNIDTNIMRTEEGYARDAFPQWRAKERSPAIVETLGKLIQANRPNIIQIQEGRKFVSKFGDEVDSVTPVVQFLKTQGYEVLIKPYNGGGGDKAFKFITAYDPKTLSLSDSSTYMRYFTKTPMQPTPRPSEVTENKEEAAKIMSSIKDNNFGVEWERGVFIAGFKDPRTGQKIYSINVHLDIPLDCRKKSSELLVKFVEEIIAKDPKAKIVISGDFNTFPQWGGAEQMDIINNAVLNGQPLLNEASRNLKLPDGSNADFSFIAFPYDFAANDKRLNMTQSLIAMSPTTRRRTIIDTYEKECKALGGVLDRVLSRGFEPADSVLVPMPITETQPDSYSEEVVRSFIVNYARKEGTPAFASDHQPVLTNFKFRA